MMVNPDTLAPSIQRHVELEAPSLDLLLFDWLNERIALKDSERAVFPRAEVRVEEGSPWRLRARLVGGRPEPGRSALRADPKAVTLHLFTVEHGPGGWRTRVVIDV
jgi:SHS2 domain-containing protein